MGIVCPLTIKYKIELSKLVRDKSLVWDTPFSQELQSKWVKLSEEIVEMPGIVFQRATKHQNAEGLCEVIAYWC